jgi:hypothetical protein
MGSVARKRCERRRARTPACWLVLASCLDANAAPADVAVRITPAWDGLVRPGATTEVVVSLSAAQATTVALTAKSEGLELVQRATLAAQSQLETALLLRPRSGGATLEIAERGAPASARAIALRVTSRSIVAAGSAAVPPERTWEDVELVRPASASWPHHAEAYSGVAEVIVDEAHVLALDSGQRAALASYAAGCGRLLYTGADALPADLRGGCGGAFARAVGADDVLTAAAALLAQAPPALPTGAALLALVHTPAAHTAPIAALLCAYGGVLAWLAHSVRRLVVVLAVPLLAALLALLTVPAVPPRFDRMVWLDTQSGDASARAMLVTAVTGRARGREALAEPGGWQLPEAIDGTPLSIDDAGRMVLDTGLLSREVHVARGVVPAPAGLQVVLEAAGPRVINAGASASLPAVLSWRGERHAVPALAPGADWKPQQATPWPDVADERLLRERSPADGAALLVPARPDATGPATWLLVHPAEARS